MYTCISLHKLKRSWHSRLRWVNAGNKNTHSMHHAQRWNVTTSKAGWQKKAGHIWRNLTPNGEPQGTRRRRLYNNDNNNSHSERHNSRSFTMSSLHHELSPTRRVKWPGHNSVQILCNTSGAHQVPRGMKGSSAIMFDRVQITFILSVFCWLKPLINDQR